MKLVLKFIKLTLQLAGWFFLGKALAYIFVWCVAMMVVGTIMASLAVLL